MNGSAGRRTRTRLLRLPGAAAAVTALVAGALAAAAPAQAAARPVVPPVPRLQAAHDLGTLTPRKPRLRNPAARQARPSGITWPAPAAGTASLSGPAPLAKSAPLPLFSVLAGNTAGHAMAAGTPVWAGPFLGSRAGGVSVRVLRHRAASAAGVNGVLFTAAASAGSGRVVVGVDYAGFTDMYGGNYGLSLSLAELPACALTTPGVTDCQKQTPLPSVNDPATRSVSATVTLPAAAPAAGAPLTTEARSLRSSAAVSSDLSAAAPGTVVLAATPAVSDGGGSAGTYAASSLKPSGTWTAGGSSGSFTYRYPIAVPPVPHRDAHRRPDRRRHRLRADPARLHRHNRPRRLRPIRSPR